MFYQIHMGFFYVREKMMQENEEGPNQPTDVAAAAAVDALGMYSTAASALAAGASQSSMCK